jgi:branched-chain amino acid transport system substrate-binding protein
VEHQPNSLSRREFLKIAGVAGASLGIVGGIGGLVAACGGTEETTTTTAGGATTTAASATSTTAATTATTAGSTTSVSAAAETGRELKLGFVSPLTGPLATFGTADQYCVSRWQEVVKNGWVCGDGKTHPISFVLRDSQSAVDRAGQVAGDLIHNDNIDIMLAASTPDTVNPVADQAEANGVPMFSNDAPWEAYFFDRGGKEDVGFHWTYHSFWGLEDVIAVDTAMWNRIPNNKVVGALWPNDADGNAFADKTSGFPGVIPAMGFTIVDPGRFQSGTEDFTAQIAAFKNGGCEILSTVLIPPDFTNFWKQALQQGFHPKVASVSKATDTPPDVEALGSAANHFTLETQWTPRMPFKSSLTGETCAQIASDFEAKAKLQWAQYLLHYQVFEVVADALKRIQNVDDKEAVVAAIASTKLDTIAGPIDFTIPVKAGTKHPVKNVYRSPLVSGQWVTDTPVNEPNYKYELAVVDNTNYPDIKVDTEMVPLAY